ncbi:MAG: hypothetical protein V1894_00755 [Chloroflexota bacterium]
MTPDMVSLSNGGASERVGSNEERHNRTASGRLHKLLIALLLVFALSVTGVVISLKAGSLIPFWLLFGVACFISAGLTFSSPHRLRRKRIKKDNTDKKAEKALKKEHKKQHQEQIQQLLPRVLEMARQNRGAVAVESIIETLQVDINTAKECLKRLGARYEEGWYYIPTVEKSFRKKDDA